MWVKLQDGGYLNLDTDRVVKVTQQSNGNVDGQYRVGVHVPQTLNALGYLMVGYATASDAQAALDEMMDAVDVVRIQPPTSPEEVADPEDDETDAEIDATGDATKDEEI